MRDTDLVNALREHAEWTQAEDWEMPITMGDDLVEAADRIANQNTHILALQKEIEGLRAQNEQLREAAALVAKESAELLEQRWIPVTERLPDQCVDILVCYRDKHILMGTARCDDWIEEDFEDGEITHWMPLPEPPEVKL